MTRVLLQPKAENDIAEIWNYIADDSEAQADAFIGELNGQLHLLALQPAMGRNRKELARGLRSFPSGRYIIFY